MPRGSPRPPNAGKGRPKGIPNKFTGQLKDMVLQALTNRGGVAYLERQAEENPGPFMGLLSKVLPMQITGQDGGAIRITVQTGVAADLEAKPAEPATTTAETTPP